MGNYLQRMFSWKGYAGRAEYLGVTMLWIGILGIGWIFMLLGFFWEVGVAHQILLGFLFIIGFLFMLYLQICVLARRFRHLGWPAWLAFLIFLNWVPVLNIVTTLLFILLFFIPSKKHEADEPNYCAFNCAFSILSVLLSMFGFSSGFGWLIDHHPDTAAKMLPEYARESLIEEYKKSDGNSSTIIRYILEEYKDDTEK